MSDQENLLAEVEAFLLTSGIAATTFGLRAVNDGKFVSRLRTGKNMTIQTLARVRDFLKSREQV